MATKIQNKNNKLTVKKIVDACGGIIEVAYALKVDTSTIRHWYKRGIPERHWQLLNSLSEEVFDVRQLHELNCQKRGGGK